MTPAQAWGLAVTGSLSVHAFAFWMLGDMNTGTALARVPSPTLDVYLLPPPVTEPLIEPEPEIEIEPEPAAEPESPSPPVPRAVPDRPQPPTATRPSVPETVDSSDRGASQPVEISRGRVDWSAEMSKVIVRMREEAPRYRSFGYPEMSDEARARAARSDREAESEAPGDVEIFPSGEQRLSLGENCYQTAYDPGTVLGEAHRFSNSFVACAPGGGPAEPRNDLFLEAKPAYLR